MNWQALSETGQLETIKSSSYNPALLGILIFKHSTRCDVSALILNRLERGWSFEQSQLPAYLLDLLNYRNLSDEIESVYGIRHESPQVLLIKDGACTYHDSHMQISVQRLADAIEEDNK